MGMDHLLSAAETVYALSPEMIKEIDCAQINALATRFADWEYIYGSPIPFNLSCGGRLSFGNAEIVLCVKNGYITDLKLYTDALDHEISNTVRETLVALPFELSVISDALFAAINEADAIALVKLFSEQIFT
jgi:lipoate-protein ligase A